jgi:hypothetical protein
MCVAVSSAAHKISAGTASRVNGISPRHALSASIHNRRTTSTTIHRRTAIDQSGKAISS